MPRVERLSGADVLAVTLGRMGWPQDIGVIAFLDAASLLDPTGTVRVDAVRAAIAGRLRLVPRFRQVVRRAGPGRGRPLWTDTARIDLSHHVQVWRLGPGADEQTLLDAVDALRQEAFDRSRPLWRMWLLTGLDDGRIAMYLRVHHAVADGVAGAALLGRLLPAAAELAPEDPMPDGQMPQGTPWAPRPGPTSRTLLADQIERATAVVGAAANRLVHPRAALHRARRVLPAVKEIFMTGPAPRTSLNVPLGPDRRMALIRSRLLSTKDAAHAFGATVNDVVLAAVAGGLRELLRQRGEPVHDLVLRAAVPVSLHRGPSAAAEGNAVGPMAVRLALAEADPGRRLRDIAADTARRRARVRPQFFVGLLASPLLQRAGLFWWGRQRFVNVYVANVVGPTTALQLAGARLREIFPVVPLTGNVTLGVGVLSYAGQLNLTVVTDRRSWPDLPVFLHGLHASLAALTRTPSGPDTSRQGPEPARGEPFGPGRR